MAEENELTLPNGDATPAQAGIAGAIGNMGQLGNKFMLLVAIAIVIAFMAVFWLWSQQPDYRILFSSYSNKDGGAIVAALEKMNIPYKFADNGGAIMVPAGNVHQARLNLATEGLPKGGNVGFELLEKQKFGVSQFIEQVNFQRALEGELERSIQSIGAVDSARLHLAIPKPSVFVRDKQSPTASVILNLRGGRSLDQQQVGAIVHLVASSVPNLPSKNVTVVDQHGNLLSDMSKKGSNNLDPSQLKYVEDIQQSVIRRVEAIITPIVGRGNVRAQANAEVDFSSVEQAAETYKPNQNAKDAVIRSQQSNETKTVNGGEAGGIPGALSNQPQPDATAPIDGAPEANGAGAAAGVPVNSQKNTTTNFEVDKTVRYSQQSMGGIKRLNVAVVVNNMPVVDAEGNTTYRPLTDAEKTQINDLAMQAMGFNQDRGDALTVVNSPFAAEPSPETIDVPLWQNPEAIEYVKDVLRFLVGVVVLFMMYKKVVKPLLARLTFVPEPPQLEGPDDGTGLNTIVNEDGTVVTLSGEVDEDGKPVLSNWQKNELSGTNLAKARQMAQENPRLVASVVSDWTTNG